MLRCCKVNIQIFLEKSRWKLRNDGYQCKNNANNKFCSLNRKRTRLR
jgi:hypothetical protein